MGINILLVDDSRDLLKTYSIRLAAEGYTVQIAASGEAALALAGRCRPDVVLTDIFMAGMSGLELITQLRDSFTPRVPVIFAMSGFPEAAAEAIRRGATLFMAKPLDLDGLVQAISDALAGREPTSTETQAALARGSRLAAAARRMAIATAGAVIDEDPELRPRAQTALQWLASYFSKAVGLLLVVDGDQPVVFATSSPDLFHVGSPASGISELAARVLETGSSLIVPDFDEQVILNRPPLGSVRFLASVPFRHGESPIGALCLVADTPLRFRSSELGTLEYLARRVTHLLNGSPAAPFLAPSGLISHDAFAMLLRNELAAASEREGGIELTIVQMRGLPNDGSCMTLLASLGMPHLALGELGRGRVGILAAHGALATQERESLVTRLAEHGKLEAGACLRFADPVPPLDAGIISAWAEELLARVGPLQESRLVLVDCQPKIATLGSTRPVASSPL